MTNTELDYGNRIGDELRDTSSLFGPPPGLFPRVAELERRRNRHRASIRAGALGLAAVATVTGLAWARQVRTHEAPAASQPGSASLGPSATVDRIDAYPVIEWPGDPIPGVGAGYSFHDDDQGWGGAIGVIHPGGAPTSIIAIHTFPIGWDTSFPDSKPGRVAGVEATTVTNGNTTLSWKVGDIPVVVTGGDIELIYQLVDVVRPIESTPQRGGYDFNGPLPAGLVELEVPNHRIPMRTPTLSTNDGTFGVAVEQGPLLSTLAGGGYTKLEPISINSLNGYRSTVGAPTIGLALSTDETLYIYGQNLTLEQLTDLAQHVTITDEVAWRARYLPAD